MNDPADLYHRRGRAIEAQALEYPTPQESCCLHLTSGDDSARLHFPDPGALIDLGHSILLEARILLARRSERPPASAPGGEKSPC